MPTRNLVVACDGTWNDPSQENNGQPAPTNVVKLKRAVASLGGQQLVHYEEGVGALEWEAIRGGIYGHGLDKRILGAYRFLRNRFADRQWDRADNKLFLFGFSRGAYTARRISGLIAHSGIPRQSRDVQLGWEVYKEKDTRGAKALKRDGRFFDVPVEMIGVWDTVKATNDADYHDAKLSENVGAGYHAMALDEKRKNFPVLKWNRNSRVTQLWFPGVHSDVGGGYAEMGLSDGALRWMAGCAHKHGLRFTGSYMRDHVKANHRGKLHDSCTGIWEVLGEKLRSVGKSDWLHKSLVRRKRDLRSYRPKNWRAEAQEFQA